MIDFAERAKRIRKGSTRERDMLWMSNFWYNITRNIKPEDKETREFFEKFGKCPWEMEKSRIAVSYALYSSRDCTEE